MEQSRTRPTLSIFRSLISLLLLQGGTSTGSQPISMIGYDISKVTDNGSNPDKVKGSVLLLDNAAQSLGILFAFSVRIENTNPFTLQLYHVDVPGKTYRLGQELTVTPSVQKGREDVYIESLLNRRCIVVRPGDRLALYVTSDIPPIQSNFNETSPTLLCNVAQRPQTGQLLNFDTKFPYSIRAAAYYIVSNDSSLSSSSETADCPFGTLIPGSRETLTISTTTTPPPITGVRGTIGVAGQQGANGYTGATGAGGSTGVQGPPGVLGSAGSTGVQGANGATGWTGTLGATGGTGATGNKGPSEVGDSGVAGPRGPPGPMGHNFTVFLNRPPPQKQAAQLSEESSDSTDPFWSSSRAIWVTYLWMAIVSFLLLIVIIIIVVIYIRRSFPTPLGSSAVTAESKTNIMDDAPTNYSDLGVVDY